MEIDYINGPKMTGIFGRARYQTEIHKRLTDVELNVTEFYPSTIPKVGFYLDRLVKYPLLVNKRVQKGNIKHITHVDCAGLLNTINLKKTIVTCYDLYIPWSDLLFIVFLYWKHCLNGLKKADRIITISKCTKAEIMKCIDYPADRIEVIYEGIDTAKYKPMFTDERIVERYGLKGDKKTILYVGSEQPRKNISTLIKAFYELKGMYENVRLIKVGVPQWKKNTREKLIELIKSLQIEKDVVIIDYVPEEDLPKIYNTADVFICPTLYEGGFSLPALEAMACGCPVVTSNIPPLIETIGADTGIMVDPFDVDGFAKAMYRVLTDDRLKEDMVKNGLERAKMFTWDKAAKDTLRVYEDVENES